MFRFEKHYKVLYIASIQIQNNKLFNVHIILKININTY